ncbi:unnamed protein product [Hermetia illucens]|uniref:Ig-like domain-containing protein n=1 Tax=Hermetia illucens TaxID=343691 RepID=A0A7R8UQW2_HERIL|nr:unnamed protein product [Hermetia illucens]
MLKNLSVSGDYTFHLFRPSLPFRKLSHQTPAITAISPEQIRDIGSSVTLNCTIENASRYAVSWAKRHRDQPSDSVALTFRTQLTINDPRFEVNETMNGTTMIYSLTINKIEATDMGTYECQVIISFQQKNTSTVNLLVKHPPVISLSETTTSVNVAEGLPTQLSCAASGYPLPTISWTREYNAIMPHGGHSYRGKVLKLDKAHREDRGTYYCIADNGVGKPDKKMVSLEVEFPPRITAPRPKVAQAIDYDVELECKVEAYPAPAIVWYRNGATLTSNSHYRITNIATAFEITNSVVRVITIDKDSYGDYYCNATNKMGHDVARINLFESVLPILSPNASSK